MLDQIKFKPMPFEQWLSLQDQEFEKVKCGECDGEGEIECECSECGHEHSTECKACDGEGYTSEAIQVYTAQVKADREKWEKFVGEMQCYGQG